jgi:quercetin dioxygenase-like cupin family protein
MNQYRITFADIDWVSPVRGIRHKVVVKDDVKLRLVEYYPEMTPHWCTVGHFGKILKGTFEIEFNDSTHVFESGDGVMIPAGEEHRHRAKVMTDVVRVIFVETVYQRD